MKLLAHGPLLDSASTAEAAVAVAASDALDSPFRTPWQSDCWTVMLVADSTAGLVMDTSSRIISVHYIRIHFGYEPGTHIPNAL